MTAVAFDTLKFARVLREKAKLSPEQAEGFADALVDVLSGTLATKGDIRDVQADIKGVRGEIEALKIRTRADIDAPRLAARTRIETQSPFTRFGIERVRTTSASADIDVRYWIVGAIGLQTLVYLYALVVFAQALR
ncbi:hypothetical protein MKK67_10175 [Methylobacterium sp. J-072]|uniref:hypothetical protein n=1 Tax=Methylobacterium sp. J-072 TaxID=2836651 RepID=UPI001FB97F30|nr:hypothetical protein [Methylobacterium sp. J-072]MCJ2092864.1 hypothetical protein [Methylobacterium sp. J-072]